MKQNITLENDYITWNLKLSEGKLISTGFCNKLSGRSFNMSSVQEITLDAKLPSLEGDQAILAIPVGLRKGDAECRYSPAVVEIVQAIAHIDGQFIQLVAVPDARQFGNTQKAGCSWVLYKVRLNQKWSYKNLKLALHCYLPENVEVQINAWVVKRWWMEYTRPIGDGYYADAPS
jgi:hypothetical protein